MTSVMGKEASLDGLEFDGDTVLCRVCGDKASGFHYGVHACEGCKGFFRRSIQQKIQYRPCLKNQQCNIMRVNRNRCQYCRLKKCIAVGMSRDAVRFGRVPKKEKARIIEQMQKSNLQTATTQMSSILISTQDLVQSVIMAHRQTSDLSQEKARIMRDLAFQKNDYVDCPAHMACPLNFNISPDLTDNQDWKDFSEFFAPAIKSVVDFAKLIPGFMLLNQDDQVTLLKAATFEVLLVRMACLFDPDTNTMMFANGRLFKRQTIGLSTSVGFLLDSMFDFAERFNKLGLSDDELALFSAVVLLSPDRPGIRNIEQIEKIQNKLTESLQNIINTTHQEDSTLFAKLLMKTTDLRTLNALHSEKTVGHGDENPDTNESQTDAWSEDSAISDMSTTTMNSASGMDTSLYDSTGSLSQNRFSGEIPHQQQQLVLKTPYGTFYREDTGFYGMVPDQPRRRCHTLDKDSMSRPRLHTIEEGNRRRYTMDREYINKMVNKLSDRLESRNAHGDSIPTSINNSAASSPIPEERFSYLNANKDFIPISTPDSNASSSCTSPAFKDYKDTLQPFSSSPNSPRPRSGSMGADDFGPMRPRCSSFHMNSEGHAARSSRPYANDFDLMSAENQLYRMSAEMRRGSVGTSYGLHAKKKSLLVDRHPAYLSRVPDAIFRKSEKPRSPLANELDSNQGPNIGSGNGSAFEQVPCLSVPVTSAWSQGQIHVDHPDPPTLSVTAPQEEPMTEATVTQLNIPVVSPVMNGVTSPAGSGRSSPVLEETSDVCSAELFHKKFDKMRKHMIQQHQQSQQQLQYQQEQQQLLFQLQQQHSTVDEMRKMENLSIQDSERNEEEEIDMETEKINRIEAENQDKPRLSAGEAHPQLLAQLTAGMQFNSSGDPGFTPILQGNGGHAVQNGDNSNVVLMVPKAPFVTRTSPTVPQVGIGSHPVLEQMIRQGPSPNRNEHYMADTSPRIISNYIMSTSPRTNKHQHFVHGGLENQTDAVTHLKDAITRKPDMFEGVRKVEQTEDEQINFHNYLNGHTANSIAHGRTMPQFNRTTVQNAVLDTTQLYQEQQFAQGFVPRSGYEGSAPLAPNIRMMYPEMYVQQLQGMSPLVAPYNQHLAGMQQLAYGNPQQRRFDTVDGQPLNLTHAPANDDTTSQVPSGLSRKINEEVIS